MWDENRRSMLYVDEKIYVTTETVFYKNVLMIGLY